jgi:hypothetical protein
MLFANHSVFSFFSSFRLYKKLELSRMQLSTMKLSASLSILFALLLLTHAHPKTPHPLVSTQASASTPGYCWIAMYTQPNYQGQGLRIAFADHYCYDLTVSQRNFPDE